MNDTFILLHYDQRHLWENNKGLSDILKTIRKEFMKKILFINKC